MTLISRENEMTPYKARSNEQVCSLRQDGYESGDFWIMTDGYTVTICEQKTFESPKQVIHVPRAEFNKMIDWYKREQKAVKAA